MQRLQHASFADGSWDRFSLCEQMANVGSEVERGLRWREKQNEDFSRRAIVRALELLDLTIEANKKRPGLYELTRTREIIVDFFFGDNEYKTDSEFLRKYFLQYNFAARKSK